ncbi:MAG: response regulator [Gloeocapsa sp. DLM2.Bin57]|nr:MAG: response regulator [Gloeocapsa sp. DLM2.Bin57]
MTIPSMYSSYDELTKNTATDIITILKRFADLKSTGNLQITWGEVKWSVYFNQGNIIYLTNSLKPEEKIDRHLRFFSKYNSQITSAVIAKTRLILFKSSKQGIYNPEYQVLYWLYQEKILSPTQSYNLIFRLIQEALESLLLLQENEYLFGFQKHTENESILIRFFLDELLTKTEERLKKWQLLTPEIESSYQSPYISREIQESQQLLEEVRKKYGKILVGYNFRELGGRLGQDELIIAQKLHPMIRQGLIKLSPPQTPFDKLPNLIKLVSTTTPQQEKIIVCVDDSPTVIRVISHYLNSLEVKIHPITESPKALMEIIRIKPHLILLDIGMPDLDGYRLCSLIRNHSALSATPIIMVTGKNGIIDRAKAKIAGATDYLTKPFGQDKLNEIVLKYLG